MPRPTGKTSQKAIVQAKAIEILKQQPKGLYFKKLVKKVKDSLSKSGISVQKPRNISTYIQALTKDAPEKVYKPEWGLFRHTNFAKPETIREEIEKPITVEDATKNEFKLYKPFAEFLEETKECTKAVVVGGKMFGDKWTTPDVVGMYELPRSSVFHPDPVIVSAEVKATTSTNELVAAFGQACMYKVFSHKVYVVIPERTKTDFLKKIESLCSILGIGLVIFNSENPKKLMWTVKVKAQRTEPDMYYADQYLRNVEETLFK